MTQNTNQTTDANTEKSIGIHYIGLDARELAIFDRVVAFNVTHGLIAHTATSIEEAELIVINQNNFSAIEFQSDKTVFMVCDTVVNNPEISEKLSVQMKRPLLLTKVMNALGETIKSVKQKRLLPNEEAINTEIDSSAVASTANRIDKPEQQVDVEGMVENSITTLDTSSESKDKIEEKQSSHHALIIDDSASIRKQLELELRDAGVTSNFAESGEDALVKVKEGQFDLIFLDIIMPGIDGYETCKQMRAMPEYKKTPIIMLSGKTSPLDEVQGVIAGATTYLTKPVKSDKLQETLNRVTKWIDNFSQAKKTETA